MTEHKFIIDTPETGACVSNKDMYQLMAYMEMDDKFSDFMCGQTGVVYNNELYIFISDVERFFRGLPIID